MLGRVCKLLGFTRSHFDDGLKHWDAGATVPADTTAGYAIGCIFIDTTGGSKVTMYCNESTTKNSCDFNAVVD